MSGLINAGGLGLLAAALFYLHVTTLKTFREELCKERELCREGHDRIMQTIHEHTREILGELRDHD